MLKNISAIIFDLGGVVIDLDVSKSLGLFSTYSGIPKEAIFEKFTKESWIQEFEKGEITAETFRHKVRVSINQSLTDQQIDDSWNAMLGKLPLPRLELLGSLQPRYKTFVLSNTNDIHVRHFDTIVDHVTNGKSINEYFNKVYYSHQLGMRKPDVEIYEFMVNENNLNPASTLFIDDMAANIEGAQSIGIKTIHLTEQDHLFELFAS